MIWPLFTIPIRVWEYFIVPPTCRIAFPNIPDEAWVKALEEGTEAILAEFQAYQATHASIPAFNSLSPEQQRIADQSWKSLILMAYGRELPINTRFFPKTLELLHNIPGLQSAMFSIFSPGTQLSPHRGPYAGVWRYHLGLIIPQERDCFLQVLNEKRHWIKGKSLLFDDSFEHFAQNNTKEMRMVLFLDMERPLPAWKVPFNKAFIWAMGHSPFISRMLHMAEQAAGEQRKA